MLRYQIGDEPKMGSVVREIIPGGMGVIYIVEFTYAGSSLKQVIKSCDVERGMSLDFRERLKSEAELWVSLDPHPRIVRAKSFEFDGGLPHLTLEYVPGGNLRQRMAEKPLSHADALRIAIEFCEGMEFLHDKNGILHLDIKPENVLFDENGRAKVTDFGLARAYQSDPNDPQGSVGTQEPDEPHVISGTLPYLAPEQIGRPDLVDLRTDVFSFGIMLFEMLTGRRPHNASTLRELVREFAKPKFTLETTQIPVHLANVVEKCLEFDRERRFESFSKIRAELLLVSEELGIDIEESSGVTAGAQPDYDEHDWNNRGYAFAQAGDFVQAISCYERGLSVLASKPRSDNYVVTPGVDKKTNATDAGFALLYANLGAVYMRLGRIEEAKSAFQAAIAVVPDDGLAVLRLGQIAIHEGRVSEGLALIKKSTECEPGNFDLLVKYLRACLAHGEIAEGERVLADFLVARASAPRVLVSLGCLLDDEGAAPQALKCFDAAIHSDPDLSSAWYNKGVALHRASALPQAIECYTRALQMARDHPFARCYLGVLLICTNKQDEGIAQLRKFLSGANPSALTQLVRTMLDGASMGIPLLKLVETFRIPQFIKHVA